MSCQTEKRARAEAMLGELAELGLMVARELAVQTRDSDEYEVLFDDLSARLDEAALSEDFEMLPIEVLARQVIADMGLSGELTLSLSETPAPQAPQRTLEPADTG